MRMLLKGHAPTDIGNTMFKDGSMDAKLNSILADMKTEAVYFMLEDGLPTGLVVFDMEDAAQMPAMIEPWFLAFGGTVTVTQR